jgi:hypothetical protein
MKTLDRRVVSALILGVMVSASPLALAKDKVVIGLQQNPVEDAGLEPTCVALQMGTGLLMSGKADVTVVATLDGVFIADMAIYNQGVECDQLSPQGDLSKKPLAEVLYGFLNAGGKVLLCPLCVAVRQPDVIDDDRIYVASPIPALLEANKVIDY